jgi:NAD+ diphosphatase
MREPNFFAVSGLERQSEKRPDQIWYSNLLSAAETRFLPVWQTKSFITDPDSESPSIGKLNVSEIAPLIQRPHQLIFLGYRDGTPYVCIDLVDLKEEDIAALIKKTGQFQDIRNVGLRLSREDGGILAYARALVHWHRTHQFCGRCGSETRSQSAGHVRRCTNTNCKTEHFPRTDPAVIMLVSLEDKICLARKRGWPDDRYSVLAGFVEPGETPEDAVVREVKEEVGIPVSNVRYHSAQPWPFPANLMLGYFAEAQSSQICIDDDEIEHARWFTREELEPEALAYFKGPHSVSIARRLIADWVLGNF